MFYKKKRKEYTLIIDTETCGGLGNPLVYDIGYLVAERKGGKIIESGSNVVRDIFFGQSRLMETAFYNKKVPQYYAGIVGDEWQVMRFWQAKSIIKDIIKTYRITRVYAYNASFDIRALNNTEKFLTHGKSTQFLPDGVDVQCIWHMACQTFMKTKKYHKFCMENGFISNCGNISTNAETAYAYLSGDTSFTEQHTAREDCIIENLVLQKCLTYHMKISERPNGMCWKLPQRG